MEIAFLILAHCFTSTIQVDNLFYTCLSIDISFYSIGANGSSVSFLYPEPLNVAISSPASFVIFTSQLASRLWLNTSRASAYRNPLLSALKKLILEVMDNGMAVSGCRKRQVGQCKDGTSLADTATVQVHRFYLHTGFGITIARFQ